MKNLYNKLDLECQLDKSFAPYIILFLIICRLMVHYFLSFKRHSGCLLFVFVTYYSCSLIAFMFLLYFLRSSYYDRNLSQSYI